MSEELFYCVLLQDGCQRRPVALLTKNGGARLDDESRFLVAVGFVLDEQTPSTLACLRARAAGGQHHAISTPRGTVSVTPETVTVERDGYAVELVSAERFVEFMDGWRAMLITCLEVGARGEHFDPPPDAAGEDSGDWATVEIVARRRSWNVFLLADGSHTESQASALADMASHPESREVERMRLLSEILAAPATSGRPTPARMTVIAELESAGVLPSPVARTLDGSGRIGDKEWDLVCAVRDLDLPVSVEIERWEVTVRLVNDRENSPVAIVRIPHLRRGG